MGDEPESAIETRQRIMDFFNTVGGVGGYVQLKHIDPDMLRKVMESFNIQLDREEESK